jgi:hypothetical protein
MRNKSDVNVSHFLSLRCHDFIWNIVCTVGIAKTAFRNILYHCRQPSVSPWTFPDVRPCRDCSILHRPERFMIEFRYCWRLSFQNRSSRFGYYFRRTGDLTSVWNFLIYCMPLLIFQMIWASIFSVSICDKFCWQPWWIIGNWFLQPMYY